ncbi:MAG TPA: tRNA (adenosine(37)-N6)-threonylcarbamoyltransferase complex ATPase subunit type 1 TsaE [Candidatus Saccharimonadales bacterium]|nr:tRNA (adenosine(37)-N6)-threonylcarbamoyltransferase complex ATPase subunit type 1 TsaE [Candidatus Saccharimonadales bacterium]
MIIEVKSTGAMQALGAKIGDRIMGGEVIVLIGDIGAGKTTFTKGLARSMGISEDVQSPTFTVSRVYETGRGVTLAHYDFYRLSDPGIMRAELMEAVHDPRAATIIEWSEIVADVLPTDTLRMIITATGEDTRIVELVPGGERSRALIEEVA